MPPLMNLPAYSTPNALINFDPMVAGVDAYQKGQENVRRVGVARNAGNALMSGDYAGAMSTAMQGDRPDLAGLAMQAKAQASQEQSQALDREHKTAMMMGGVAQRVLDMHKAGDTAGARTLYSRIAAHPNMAQSLSKHGIDPNDHLGASQFLMAQAAGYRDPLDVEAKRAQISMSNAHAGLFAAQAANAKNGGDAPMPIKEWQRFSAMGPEDQQKYLLMKRAAEKPLDTGTEFVRPNAMNPMAPPTPVVRKDNAGKAFDQEEGKAAGKSAAALPSVIASTNRIISSIDAVINDPGLSNVTGLVGGRIPKHLQTPGMAETQSKLDQIQGQTFMQAYNEIRGAGQISNQEGAKAEAAYNRLRTQTMGTPAYIDALKEFRNEVLRMAAIAKERAKRPGSAPAAQPAAPAANGGWSIQRVD